MGNFFTKNKKKKYVVNRNQSNNLNRNLDRYNTNIRTYQNGRLVYDNTYNTQYYYQYPQNYNHYLQPRIPLTFYQPMPYHLNYHQLIYQQPQIQYHNGQSQIQYHNGQSKIQYHNGQSQIQYHNGHSQLRYPAIQQINYPSQNNNLGRNEQRNINVQTVNNPNEFRYLERNGLRVEDLGEEYRNPRPVNIPPMYTPEPSAPPLNY